MLEGRGWKMFNTHQIFRPGDHKKKLCVKRNNPEKVKTTTKKQIGENTPKNTK